MAEGRDSSEQRLVRRLQARDERAFRELVETYQHLVFNLVYRMLGNREEAEEVSQEVFVTVFRAIASFRGDSRLSTWLYRISANHAKNRLKYLARRRSGRQDPIDDVAEGELHRSVDIRVPEPDKATLDRELEALIQRGLQTLDEDHRLIIVLRDIEDLSYEEIVEVTGAPLGTVKSRLFRARSALREAVLRLQNKRGSR